MTGKQLWNQTAQRWMKSNPSFWGRKWDNMATVEQHRWNLMAADVR